MTSAGTTSAGVAEHAHGAPALAAVPLLALLVAGYAYGAALAGQPPGPDRTPTRRAVAWYAGLGVVAVALFAPLGGSHALTAHMLQHELLLTVAPLLLVAGLDARVSPRFTLPAVLHGPAFATALWVAVVLGGHLPPVYAAILADPRLHLAHQAGLVGAGVVFWVAVGRGPGTAASRLAALGVATAASGALAAVLIWSGTAVYPGAASGAALPDQRWAGALMMVLDMPVLLGAVTWVVAGWAREQASVPDAAVRPGRGAPWPST